MPGTVIIAAQHNTPLVDLQTANNYERPIIAGGTGAGSIAGMVDNFSLVQYAAQTLDDAQKAQARLNIGSATAGTFEPKNANYTILAEDLGKTFLFTASATASFEAAADLGANFECEIWANFGVTLTLDPSASETINGAATYILQPGDKVSVWCNGTAFFAKASGDPLVGPQLQGLFNGLALTTNVTDAANDVDIAVGAAASDVSPYYLMQLASALTKRIDSNWVVGTNQGGLDTGAVANATYYIWLIQRSDTLVTDALFSLSSTAPTMPTNYDRKRLIGVLTRSAAVNSTPGSLLIPGNIQTATSVTLSGTNVPFFFPTSATRIVISWASVSTSGTTGFGVQIGDSGGIETTGYLSSESANVSTIQFAISGNTAAAGVYHGAMTLTKHDAATNTWVSSGTNARTDVGGSFSFAGSKSTSAPADRLIFRTTNGVETFDAGTVNITYQ